MGKSKKSKQPSMFEMSPDDLEKLDAKTLVGFLSAVMEQNRQLTELLQQMVREKHGPKTEHFENPNQLRLFDAGDAEATQQPESTPSPQDCSSSASGNEPNDKKKRKGHGRNPMPTNIERKRITGDEPCDLTCKHCASAVEKLAEILRNSRYEQVPTSIVIEDFVAMVFQCKGCNDTFTVEPPTQEIENGIAGPVLITDIAVSKFEDHMPWNRQEQRFARLGVPIARSTMVGWMKWLADKLRPLYNRMHQLLLQSDVIATDDTPVKVQDRSLRRKIQRKLKIKTGRMWIYRGDEKHPFNIFNYTEGRARAGPTSTPPNTFMTSYKLLPEIRMPT